MFQNNIIIHIYPGGRSGQNPAGSTGLIASRSSEATQTELDSGSPVLESAQPSPKTLIVTNLSVFFVSTIYFRCEIMVVPFGY